MDVIRCGAVPTRPGNPSYFTGQVWQDPIVEAPEPARVMAVRVAFAPGARTYWHTHPLGQTLYVVSGCGRAQTWGGPLLEIKAGDTVWIPPGEKHWHGASPNGGMVHIAIQEREGASAAEWMEAVSDEQFGAKAQ